MKRKDSLKPRSMKIIVIFCIIVALFLFLPKLIVVSFLIIVLIWVLYRIYKKKKGNIEYVYKKPE